MLVPGHTDTVHSLWGRMLVVPDSHWSITNKVDVGSAFLTTIIATSQPTQTRLATKVTLFQFAISKHSEAISKLTFPQVLHVFLRYLPFTDQVGNVTLVHRTASEITIIAR